jgi:hypothetical protein
MLLKEALTGKEFRVLASFLVAPHIAYILKIHSLQVPP